MEYPDIYYLPQWLEMYYCRDGENYGYYELHSKNGTIIYPYVLRQTLLPIEGKYYYDIITPYGFNGPLILECANGNREALLKEYEADLSDYCQGKDIIAEYIRFSPWLKNHEDFKSIYALRDNNKTVAIDLSVEDILRDECNSKRRNQVRLAEKKGVQVIISDCESAVDDFLRLYEQTIAKNNIGSYYTFDEAFLKRQFDILKGHVFIAEAQVDNKIISASFILHQGEHLHYHLSANDYSMSQYQGNSLLLYNMALWGKEHGCKYFHLGGVGVADKSLMDFKLSFTRQTVFPFYVGTKIRNKHIYDFLTEKCGSGNINYFPAYRG